MERQAVTTHKDRGDRERRELTLFYSAVHNATYPLKLLERVITVSLETKKIVHGLQRLVI